MKVVVINGSARMEKGNTALILTPFIEGMQEAGAEVELLYTKKINVKPCTGEFHCWYVKPGECYITDGMQEIYPKLREAEILVLAAPVYIPLPGEMQNFINRLCPLTEPIISKRNERTRAKFHENVKTNKIVLVSTCGWWEKGNFSTVLRVVKEIASNNNIKFAGALLRPHAYHMKTNKEKANEIFDAAKLAGSKLIKEGKMPQKLLDTISQPLISRKKFTEMENNQYMKVKKFNEKQQVQRRGQLERSPN